MELSTWILFTGIALISIISPGPAVLLSVTNSLTHGFKQSIFSSLGNVTGVLIVSATAAMGLGALLEASALLFTILKVAGAVYLIYLGIRQLRAKHNSFNTHPELNIPAQGYRKLYVQGVLVALSNPKAVLFFTALFPQFINVSRPLAPQFTILTSTFMLLSFLTLVLYAKTAQSFKHWFSNSNRALWFNRISGMVFIIFGIGILRLRNRAA